MGQAPDGTCDPSARSWVASANTHPDFPIQNLPLGIFDRPGTPTDPCVGTAIGDHVLDLAACGRAGLLGVMREDVQAALDAGSLNALLTLGLDTIDWLRLGAHGLLRDDAPDTVAGAVAHHLLAASEVEPTVPVVPGQFTDFFASRHHAERVSRLRTPDAPLPPAYTYVPLGYHGAAASLRPSGVPIRRPCGVRPAEGGAVYAPTERLDYEAELGIVLAGGSAGAPVSVTRATDHIAGACLLNDWSARDVQAFESQPLGPLVSKSFATSVSPWLITASALAPFRYPVAERPPSMPPLLPHLSDERDQRTGAWDITVEVWLSSEVMRSQGIPAIRLSHATTRMLFWSPAQLVAQLTSSGCAVRPGDLLGTGTVSGPGDQARSTLVELTRGGRAPLTLPTGETRAYLQDGDEVGLRAHCSAPGAVRIGFGECRTVILPATSHDGAV